MGQLGRDVEQQNENFSNQNIWKPELQCIASQFFGGETSFFLSLMFDLHRLLVKDRHDLITCTVYICRNLTFKIFRILSQTTSGLRHHCFLLSNSKTTLSKPYRNRIQCKSRALDFLVQWAGYKMTRKPVRKKEVHSLKDGL